MDFKLSPSLHKTCEDFHFITGDSFKKYYFYYTKHFPEVTMQSLTKMKNAHLSCLACILWCHISNVPLRNANFVSSSELKVCATFSLNLNPPLCSLPPPWGAPSLFRKRQQRIFCSLVLELLFARKFNSPLEILINIMMFFISSFLHS